MSLIERQLLRVDASRIVDGDAVDLSPGSIILETTPSTQMSALPLDMHSAPSVPPELTGPMSDVAFERIRIIAVGRPAEVDQHESGAIAKRLDLGRAWLLPPFVNAHTHLDLTHMGPRELDERGFEGFVAAVRAERCVEESDVAASIRRGVAMSRAGGVVAVGDIGGAVRGRPSLSAWRALRASGMSGVSFLEFFAAGRGWQDRIASVEHELHRALSEINLEDKLSPARKQVLGQRLRLGLQPHAPYSVCHAAYTHALALAQTFGLPLCTHLAETMLEREFIGQASGPFRALLESIGLWDDALLAEYGRGLRPIEHLRAVLAERPMLAVHLNDVSDAEIESLAAMSGLTVVYCPRASDYFRSSQVFGPHCYREMIRAGIRVVLGTDSIVNLPKNCTRISTLDEAVHLHRRDGLAFSEALGMVTWKAAQALSLDSSAFVFKPGHDLAGLVAVEGIERGDVRVHVLARAEADLT